MQSVAYALAEYLDVKKNMVTQTMRMRNGYTIQCKGDAQAEWTKYIGMDVALSVELIQNDDILEVNIGFDKWLEKLGIAAVGAIFLHPLLLTTGIGALRHISLPQDIFTFIETHLHVEPIEEEKAERTTAVVKLICPHCGVENKAGSLFCRSCGQPLEKEVIVCPSCQSELDGDETFCPFCGEKLK